MNASKTFSIIQKDYKANIIYKLKDNCIEYRQDITFDWVSLPDAIISDDNLSLEIPFEKLKDGNITLNVNVSYNKENIAILTGNTLLVTDKVIIL